MSDSAPASRSERIRKRSDAVGDTTKWLVGGVVTTAAAVLAGSTLTKLGELEPGPRLWAAAGGAALAYLLLGWVLWNALGVVEMESLSISDLADRVGRREARALRVEARFKGLLPGGATSFAELIAKDDRLAKAAAADADARRDLEALRAAGAELSEEAAYEYKRAAFIALRRKVFAAAPVVVLGVGIFAWAANPPEPKVLSGEAHAGHLSLDAATVARLGPKLRAGCYPSANGRAEVPTIVLAQLEGRTEVVTVPRAEGCEPVRLTLQNGDVFVTR